MVWLCLFYETTSEDSNVNIATACCMQDAGSRSPGTIKTSQDLAQSRDIDAELVYFQIVAKMGGRRLLSEKAIFELVPRRHPLHGAKLNPAQMNSRTPMAKLSKLFSWDH